MDFIEDGCILLARKLLDSQVWKNEGLLKVWIWCLLKASHKECIWENQKTGKGNIPVKIGKGQFIFGRHRAAKELSMNPETVRKRMHKLEKMKNLTMQSTSQYTIVTICNYEPYQDLYNYKYQDKYQPSTNQVPTKYQPSTNQVPHTNMESMEKNGKEKNPPNPPKGGTVKKRKKIVVTIPDCLDVPEFKETWAVWIDYLIAKRKKPTEHTKDLQLRKLAKYPVDTAIRMINQSIEKGWQGLFPIIQADETPTEKAEREEREREAKERAYWEEHTREYTQEELDEIGRRYLARLDTDPAFRQECFEKAKLYIAEKRPICQDEQFKRMTARLKELGYEICE